MLLCGEEGRGRYECAEECLARICDEIPCNRPLLLCMPSNF